MYKCVRMRACVCDWMDRCMSVRASVCDWMDKCMSESGGVGFNVSGECTCRSMCVLGCGWAEGDGCSLVWLLHCVVCYVPVCNGLKEKTRGTSLTNIFKVKVKVIKMNMSILCHASVYCHAQFECHSLNIVFLCRSTMILG